MSDKVESGKRRQALEELLQMLSSLGADVRICQGKINEEGSQFWRRTFIRSFFALVEGLTYGMKMIAVKAYEDGTHSFSEADISMLKEITYDLNDKGDTYSSTKYIPISKNLKFAVKSFQDVYDAQYTLKLDDSGWEHFRLTLNIRNRLTHPKQLTDLDITNDEFDNIRKGVLWYLDSMEALMRSAAQSVEGRVDSQHSSTHPNQNP